MPAVILAGVGGVGVFASQIWCCLGLFCEHTQAYYLLQKVKLAVRYRKQKNCCVGFVTVQGFLNHCIAPHFVNKSSPSWCLHPLHGFISFLNLAAPLVKQYIRNPSSVAGSSMHWCVLLFFFELLCLWKSWKCKAWKQTCCFAGATFQLHTGGAESLWFLPAPCHSGFGLWLITLDSSLSHSTLRFHI